MMRRALRIASGIALALTATALTHAVIATHASNPTCGPDDSPVCPIVSATSPTLIDGTPSGDVRMTLTGSALGGVVTVLLLPAGQALDITDRSDTQLVVIVPRGAMSSGNTYSLQLALDGQTSNLTVSSPIAVTEAGAPAPPVVSLLPAPTVTPVPRIAPTVAAVTPAVDSPSSGLGGAVLFWLLGVIVAAVPCVIVARRKGLLDELGGPFSRGSAALEPAAPTWSLIPSAPPPSAADQPSAIRATPVPPPALADPPARRRDDPIPVAVAATGDPTPAQAWSIREQYKPAGPPERFRTPQR
jgi:hypothetical protein